MAKQSVKKNYIYNVLYQILTIITPLITTPYLSRTLGAENIGIYGYTLSIVNYFILIGSLGVTMYGQREIAYVQDNRNKRSKVLYEILIMKCITMFIALIVFCFIFCTRNEYSLYYQILIIEIIANMIDISWFFQGLEEFKKTVIRNTIIKIVSVVAVFVFIKTIDDLYKYFIIYVLSTLLGNLSLWFYLPKYITKQKIKSLNIFKHLKPTILLFIPQIAVQVYTLLDKTMLGILSKDMATVGYYEQSQKIIKTALVIVTALGAVVAPRIASIISKGEEKEVNNYLSKSYHFVWMIGFPIMIGIIGISKTLVPWFLGEEFLPSIPILMIGAVLIISIGLNNVSGIQYLIPAKKQNLFTKSVVIAAGVNFGLNLLLIPKFNAIGAICSSVVAETLIIFIQAYDIRKDINLKIIINGSVKYIIGAIIMLFPLLIIGKISQPTMITTLFQICIGALIYGEYLLIIKDKYLYGYIDKIIKKIKKEPA